MHACWVHDDEGLATMHLKFTIALLNMAAADQLAHMVAAIELPAHENHRFQALAHLPSWGKQEVLRCVCVHLCSSSSLSTASLGSFLRLCICNQWAEQYSPTKPRCSTSFVRNRLVQYMPLILLTWLTPAKISAEKIIMLRALHSHQGHMANIGESIDLLIKSWSDFAFCIKVKLQPSLCLLTGVQVIRDAALASRDSLAQMWSVEVVQRPKLGESLLFGELSERFGPSYFLSGRMGELSHADPKKVRTGHSPSRCGPLCLPLLF